MKINNFATTGIYLLAQRKRLRAHEELNLTWKSQPTQYFPMVSQMQIPIPNLPSYFLSSSSIPARYLVCILTNALPNPQLELSMLLVLGEEGRGVERPLDLGPAARFLSPWPNLPEAHRTTLTLTQGEA